MRTRDTAVMTRTIQSLLLASVFCVGSASSLYAQAQEEVLYYHTDAIGSVRMITDANGQVVERRDYLPFGEPWPNPPSVTDPGFTGQERDVQTGFNYFAARYYASGSGRFTVADDPLYIDPFDPRSMNRYAYAYNNPLRYNDPTGHSADCIGVYNDRDGSCKPDLGFLRFLEWTEELARQSWGSVQQLVTAPRDPTCIARSVGIGMSMGGFAGGILGGVGGGAGGAFGGSFVAPGFGTVGGGFAGSAAGSAHGTAAGAFAGGAVGGAVGSIACMGGANGGGGGGGADREHMTGEEIISRYKKASIRQVFPGQYLPKTLAEIRKLAAGDRAAKTALKLLTDSRFDK